MGMLARRGLLGTIVGEREHGPHIRPGIHVVPHHDGEKDREVVTDEEELVARAPSADLAEKAGVANGGPLLPQAPEQPRPPLLHINHRAAPDLAERGVIGSSKGNGCHRLRSHLEYGPGRRHDPTQPSTCKEIARRSLGEHSVCAGKHFPPRRRGGPRAIRRGRRASPATAPMDRRRVGPVNPP